ncbi:MAG: hypothetical protein WD994_04495 [Pseudomonadales bacterium]
MSSRQGVGLEIPMIVPIYWSVTVNFLTIMGFTWQEFLLQYTELVE